MKVNEENSVLETSRASSERQLTGLATCAHSTVVLYVTHGRFAPPQRYWGCQECGANFIPSEETHVPVGNPNSVAPWK